MKSFFTMVYKNKKKIHYAAKTTMRFSTQTTTENINVIPQKKQKNCCFPTDEFCWKKLMSNSMRLNAGITSQLIMSWRDIIAANDFQSGKSPGETCYT